MKLFLICFLSFSIYSDFAVASEDMVPCESQVVEVTEASCHGHHDEESSSQENHCHCHLGHTHSGPIVTTSLLALKISLNHKEISYPELEQKETRSFHLDIIKPPIHS